MRRCLGVFVIWEGVKMVVTILKVAGLICWALSALGVNVPKINLVALGLFLFFLPEVL